MRLIFTKIVGLSALSAPLAHIAGIASFCSVVYALIFPENVAPYIANLTNQVRSMTAVIEDISDSSSVTAAATTRLAENISRRPRYEIRVYGSTDNRTFVFDFSNPSAYPISEMVHVFFGEDGEAFSSMNVFILPPFERATDTQSAPTVASCYSYVIDDGTPVRLTEYREFRVNRWPTPDSSGNQATYDVNFTMHTVERESELDSFNCRGQRLLSGFRR